jgi:hypothetical protein
MPTAERYWKDKELRWRLERRAAGRARSAASGAASQARARALAKLTDRLAKLEAYANSLGHRGAPLLDQVVGMRALANAALPSEHGRPHVRPRAPELPSEPPPPRNYAMPPSPDECHYVTLERPFTFNDALGYAPCPGWTSPYWRS